MAKEFATIEQAVEDLRAGKLILCIDDPDRENEGDLICAAPPIPTTTRRRSRSPSTT